MKLNENTLPRLSLLFCVAALFLILVLSTGITGDTDSITHYLFARYAFKHPGLFLEHWGKPLFTILSAPLAQFGYTGAMLFNLLCGVLTAWLIYRIAKKLLYDYAWAVIPMVIFTPVYLINMYTSLTEILFSLVLVAAIYFFLHRRYILSALVISLIPFARTEGLMFLPLFLLAYLWMRAYKAIPFLAAGFILFGLLGIPKYGDFWWFFTAMPYSERGSDLYGSGSFFFYFARFPQIMGYPLILLALIGTLTMSKWLVSARKLYRDVGWTTEYVLILPAFFGFILVHSFLWWQGLMGVLASYRFMACILPLGALIALSGFNVIINNLSYDRVRRNRIGAVIMAAILVMPFVYYKIPFISRGSFDTIEKAAEWLKESPYKDRFVYYFDPTVPFYIGEDPWDRSRVFEIAPDRENPEKSINDNTVVFWENNLGAYAKGLSFDKLLYNPHFKLLNIFVPRKDFRSATGDFYLLAIFEKTKPDTAMRQFSTFRIVDFEQPVEGDRAANVTDTAWHSASHAYRLPGESFSPGFQFPVDELPGNETVFMRLSGKFRIPAGFPEGKLVLVMEVRNAHEKMYRYLTANDRAYRPNPGEWFEMNFLTAVNKAATVGGKMKLYAWNQSKEAVLVDDLMIEYFPVPE